MIAQVLKVLLIPSCAGTTLAALLSLSKPLTKKIFGCAWHYYIWLAVLFVMVLPVRFYIPIHRETPPLFAASQQIQNQTLQQNEQMQTNKTDQQTPGQTAAESPAIQKNDSFIKRISDSQIHIFAVIWLTGMFLSLLALIAGYVNLIRKVHKTSVIVDCPEIKRYTKRKIIVRAGNHLASPFVIGFFRPILVLPSEKLSKDQLDHILRHELTHLKRNDLLYKWFAAIVRCVHWFNPMAYLIVRQINTECEISCDDTVVANMNEKEKQSYMNTILTLLSRAKTQNMPLTTGMTGSKKILKRRFMMIYNKKRTSKIISALSVIIAVILLSSTVFASGVLSEWAADDNDTIEILNRDGKINLTNKPFIENSAVYLPLRETFEKIGVMDHSNSKIMWDNGKIDIKIAVSTTKTDTATDGNNINNSFSYFIRNYKIEIGKSELIENAAYSLSGQDMSVPKEMDHAPILKNSITYVPYQYITTFLDTNWGIGYIIYDNITGDIIAVNSNPVLKNSDSSPNEAFKYANNTPESVIKQFFSAFSQGEFDVMKHFCTEECVGSFFGDGYVFGMTEASLADINIDPLEYAKSSNDFNALVTVHMPPHPNSVFDPKQTSTSFYVCLLRQPDGKYLINEFATGL